MAAVAEPARGEKFLDWCGGSLATLIGGSSPLKDEATIVADYITGGKIGAFAQKFWEQKGIRARFVRPIDPNFYDFWHGPDPLDRDRKACDTHHWPVWIPEGLCLATLERAGLRFIPTCDVKFERHRNTSTLGAYYAVMRKDVLGRNLKEDAQIQQLKDAGYSGLARAVDVAAVVFAIHQHDGSLCLAKGADARNRRTYALCKERVTFGEYEFPLMFGENDDSGLRVVLNGHVAPEHVGVAALREF